MARGGLEKGTWVVIGTCTCVWLIVTIGLIAGSFAVLTPQEYGLKFNSVTITLDDEQVYTAGRIYVGVGGSFYKYPKKLTYVEFSGRQALDVWSKDGQSVFVECSFYYKLKGDRIHDLFYTYGEEYDAVIRNIAAEEIRNVATRYETLEFFTNRSAIDTAMTIAMQSRVSAEAFADIALFNLLGIDVPDAFDAAVAQKVITGQDVLTLEQLRQSQIIRSSIAVIDATATGNITVINAQATAEGTLVQRQTAAGIFVDYMVARAQLLEEVAAQLNFTTVKHMLQYVYTDVIRGRTAATTTVALDANGITPVV